MDNGCLTRGGLCICRKHLGVKEVPGDRKLARGGRGLRLGVELGSGLGG